MIRFTPFGNGLATVIIPQLLRHENSLFLWNVNNVQCPVHCFYGHRDVIVDFGFAKCGGDQSKEFRLVSV